MFIGKSEILGCFFVVPLQYQEFQYVISHAFFRYFLEFIGIVGYFCTYQF